MKQITQIFLEGESPTLKLMNDGVIQSIEKMLRKDKLIEKSFNRIINESADQKSCNIPWLINFNLMLHFYIPWKHWKTKGFLTFSGGIEMDVWVYGHFVDIRYCRVKINNPHLRKSNLFHKGNWPECSLWHDRFLIAGFLLLFDS